MSSGLVALAAVRLLPFMAEGEALIYAADRPRTLPASSRPGDIRAARGEAVEDWSPEIRIDRAGSLPSDYVPEPEMRLNIYARLARVSEAHEAESLSEEIDDRFGPPPPEVQDLLTLARLRALCRALGVARVDAGPKAIALDLRPNVAAADLVGRASPGLRDRLTLKGARLIYAQPSGTSHERLSLASDLLAGFG